MLSFLFSGLHCALLAGTLSPWSMCILVKFQKQFILDWQNTFSIFLWFLFVNTSKTVKSSIRQQDGILCFVFFFLKTCMIGNKYWTHGSAQLSSKQLKRTTLILSIILSLLPTNHMMLLWVNIDYQIPTALYPALEMCTMFKHGLAAQAEFSLW